MNLSIQKYWHDDPFMIGRVVLSCILMAGPVAWTLDKWEKEQRTGAATLAHEHAFKKINASLQQASAIENDSLRVTRAFPSQSAEVIVSGQSVDACVKLTGGMIDERFKRCISTYTGSGLR
jgi:hypothetical protein